MQAEELIGQEIDPDSDVYDDELRDKDEPVDKVLERVMNLADAHYTA